MILDASYTLLVACIALLIGMFVVKFTPFLQKNHIPEAVVGGFIVAIVLLIIDKTSGYSFTFDASLQSLLMLTFFSSIGGQFGYRKLLYVKLIFYHFWFFWKRNILDVKTVMRGH
ncbi:TPA: sodium/glutamate symporter [Escherichia coli]